MATPKPKTDYRIRPKRSKTFIVTVVRTGIGFRDFQVEGVTTERQARSVALNSAPSYSFSEKNSDYEIEGMIQLVPGTSSTRQLPVLAPINDPPNELPKKTRRTR